MVSFIVYTILISSIIRTWELSKHLTSCSIIKHKKYFIKAIFII